MKQEKELLNWLKQTKPPKTSTEIEKTKTPFLLFTLLKEHLGGIFLAMKESFCQDWSKNLEQLADGNVCQGLTE